MRVGSERPNGRFETVRPGSGRNLAVRPANLRVLLEEFNGRAAGDTMDFDDGEIELLGFDAQESYWLARRRTCIYGSQRIIFGRIPLNSNFA